MAFLQQQLPLLLIAIFCVLGLWHIYWALGGTLMKSAAIPVLETSIDAGERAEAFEPGAALTGLVGLLILGIAGLVAAASELVVAPVSGRVAGWCCLGLALVFAARAIGDFRYVGFFKTIKNSEFSRYDTLAYSPLCCLLALGLIVVGGSAVS